MLPVTMDCPSVQTGPSLPLALSIPKPPLSPPADSDSDISTQDITGIKENFQESDAGSMGLPTPTSASSQDLDHDHDSDYNEPEDDILAKIQVKLDHLWSLYNSGKPLFPRALLADLDSQIDSGNADVQIEDLDGVKHDYGLQVPGWCKDFAPPGRAPSRSHHDRTSYRIGYSSIQNLTCIHPSFPELSLRDNSPVAICYTSCVELYPQSPLADVQKKFKEHEAAWEESETCSALVRHLEKIKVSGKLTKNVRKIVGFGLGSLGCLGDEFHCVRAHAQHAAVKTMARVLGKGSRKETGAMHFNGTGHANGYLNGHSDIKIDRDPSTTTSTSPSNGNATGMNHDTRDKDSDPEIKCYAQDPAYNDVDMTLLRSIGIEPLDDPKGFLEIDEHTLVFSVSPNVPVKQIVADVAWPGAMIWNTVAREEEVTQWEKKERDGEEFWVVPFTTDPDSPRVRDMVQHYASVPLRDSDEYFGDLTIYVR
ncbi:SRR1 family protein [Aspergillus undulatus]|uniref:SRR1 family protein n=1 Tax=Aspergillus undulatus TaxID=1810928 RepID=UPI003CCCBCD3